MDSLLILFFAALATFGIIAAGLTGNALVAIGSPVVIIFLFTAFILRSASK